MSSMYPSALPMADRSDFERHCKAVQWQYSYLTRNLKSIYQNPTSDSFRASLAFFDSDGYLISLYGPGDKTERLMQAGIVPGTIWRREEIGINAVTNGLAYQISTYSIGDENELPLLRDYALYYVHIHLHKSVQNDPEDNAPLRLGGIALIVSRHRADPDYMLTLNALVHDLEMTLHFNQTSMHLYNREKTGLLIVDTDMYPGQNTILYTNEMLFKALGVPAADVWFSPLQDFLPPEGNEPLWQMIAHKNHVADQPVTVTVGGRSVNCQITCDVYRQPVIDAEGVILYITTPQIESRRIAKKMGNSAILSFSDVVGVSTPIRSAIRKANLIAGTDSNVLILGESGVGKDVFAQAIHNASARRNKPFIAVNCGALPRELIASELFGYDTGAFTGARKGGNIGKFELADGGTIFLDEIGELPMDLQASLLRVVEQKQLMRLGGNKLLDVDVKIISATNANIPEMISQKRFRADLFYRLGTMKLILPPLRERREDILPLSEHFIDSICRRIGRPSGMKLSPEAAELLQRLPWNGNVRELQYLLESIVQLYPGDTIHREDILENLMIPAEQIPAGIPPVPTAPQVVPVSSGVPASSSTPVSPAVPASPSSPPPTVSEPGPPPVIRRRKTVSREDVIAALEINGNNRSKAADSLGISRRTFYRYMERYGMADDQISN